MHTAEPKRFYCLASQRTNVDMLTVDTNSSSNIWSSHLDVWVYTRPQWQVNGLPLTGISYKYANALYIVWKSNLFTVQTVRSASRKRIFSVGYYIRMARTPTLDWKDCQENNRLMTHSSRFTPLRKTADVFKCIISVLHASGLANWS